MHTQKISNFLVDMLAWNDALETLIISFKKSYLEEIIKCWQQIIQIIQNLKARGFIKFFKDVWSSQKSWMHLKKFQCFSHSLELH